MMEFNYVFICDSTFLTWIFKLINELLFFRNTFICICFSFFVRIRSELVRYDNNFVHTHVYVFVFLRLLY